MRRLGKRAEPRRDTARRLADGCGRYGCRGIWPGPRPSGAIVSEKAARGIVAGEGLVARCIGRECDAAPAEAGQRRLRRAYSQGVRGARSRHAVGRGHRRYEGGGREGASESRDHLFDSMVAARSVSRSPRALLASTMPEGAISTLPDRGVHCRRDGRIGPMGGHGLMRSMSRRARSPGNAGEGFFGRLEVEMRHGTGRERGGGRAGGRARRMHGLAQQGKDQGVARRYGPLQLQEGPGARSMTDRSKQRPYSRTRGALILLLCAFPLEDGGGGAQDAEGVQV